MQTSKGWKEADFHIQTQDKFIKNVFFSQNEVFYLNYLHSAFEADALASSHPLNPPEADIQSPTDIYDLFDDIAYNKVGDED